MAAIDLSEFDCARCAEAERQGRDLRAEFSGQPASCEGPRSYRFFSAHPSGGIGWTGCPRSALTARTAALVAVFDRAEGRLSYTEQRTAPGVLLDAFAAIDFGQGVRRWQESKDATAQWQRKP